ncbi:MAG TPA: YihY/virulence factor BrkB family protein [Longimicrobiales bacterium]
MGDTLGMLKETVKEFSEDKCPQMAAAISYATVFALPPLLMLLLYLVGLFVDPQDFRGRIVSETQGMLGADGARLIGNIIEQAHMPGGGAMAVIGVVMVVIGATGAFVQLQDAVNTAWEVKPDPKQGGVKAFIGKRLLSFGMILVIGFLMLVSFVVSALVSALGDMLRGYLGGSGELIAHIVQIVLGLGITWVLFALMFKYLPDAEISWRDVAVGAFVTALLFTVGRFAIGLYLGHNKSTSAFGAAAALAVLLIWVYYAAMILLLGAEFTEAWARRRGGIRPEAGAVRITDGGSPRSA